MSIESTKRIQGYLDPLQRPCCFNCASMVEEISPFQPHFERLHCKVGCFYVRRHAICDRHTPRNSVEAPPTTNFAAITS